MTPTRTLHTNKYALLAGFDDDDGNLKPAAPTAISDTGATGHFLTSNAPVQNKQVTTNPISILLPNGNTLQSTHTCEVAIPGLRPAAKTAHVVPGLSHASLLSTAVFCDAGYTLTYDANACHVRDGPITILTGTRDSNTGLWLIPLTEDKPTAETTPHHAAHNVHTITHLTNRVKFMHQAFFCPPIQTLLRAANLGFLDNIPFFTPDLINAHLEKTPATAKGRLKLRPMGHHSTRRPGTQPSDKHAAANMFCYAALADKQANTFYTDCTGNLPARSLDGQQLFFVAYAYDPNYIFAVPIKSTTTKDIMDAFAAVYNRLDTHGFKPTFAVADNQAATAIKAFMKSRDGQVQFVEPNNHRTNAAERAIQTFKNHFISGLCTTDANFPLQLWNHLAEQAEITCNILRRSRLNPTISAYHQLHGHKYNWNAHPLAPPGTRAVIHVSPTLRTAWGPRGVDAWYCGPALDHYRCHHFYVPDTRAMRISGTYELYPQHCHLPTLSQSQHLHQVIRELLRGILQLPRHKRRIFFLAIMEALHALTKKGAPKAGPYDDDSLPWPTSKGDPLPINTPLQPHTSTNPTAPHSARAAPRLHMRQTRANTPPTNSPTTTQEPPSLPEVQPSAPPYEPQKQPIPRRSPRLALSTPQQYSNAATAALTQPPDMHTTHFCAPVIHPVTGASINKYATLMRDNGLRDIWQRAFGKEFGNLAQGDDLTGTPGTNTIYVLSHEEIKNIPRDRTVTYVRIVIDYRPQKADPNRVRLTAGGNLIEYPYELTTRTADLTTAKILWNSTISTEGARYMCLDIKNFYLGTPMTRYEYMKMPLSVFPEHIVRQYKLDQHAKNGFVYIEIRKAIYGLPQAGILANQLLRRRLRPHGYYEVLHTPGLWKHTTRPTQFTLTVDDFGVKYIGRDNAIHLITALRKHYELKIDWEGKLYCGITLTWNYDKHYVDISMPKYVDKLLAKFDHTPHTRPQHSPHTAPPRSFGTDAQIPIPHDTLPILPADRICRIQQIVGTIMYYARAVDLTTLVALSSIASEQSKATSATENKAQQLLNYLRTHNNATIRYTASDMILNVHSDASYLSEPHARSRIGGVFFLGSQPVPNHPIKLNGPIHISANICKFVVASAAEAELGALFYNCQDAAVLRLTLEELGHMQPATPVHCDNSTAAAIANDTIKKQRSRAMEKNFFWVADQVARKNFTVTWHPGKENLADYFTKHFDAKHHQTVRPYYLHLNNSPTHLPRALAPSTLKGCVGTLPDGYARSAPLPRLQQDRAISLRTTRLAKAGNTRAHKRNSDSDRIMPLLILA